jgi:V/A-type H+-transporting ATPase subunit I
MAFIESMIEAFEAVLAYLANTISFVRLAAYAMSHAAILMATFAMADAVAETPAVGGVLYVAIVIGGNAVALVLEGIIVAVQVLRLEYYEFFGKFFSGSGLPFRPFHFALRR